MRDKTKRSNLLIGLGFALLGDSLFLLSMYIIAVLDGTFRKMPEHQAVEMILLICIGGVSMLFIAYYIITKEYNKPKEKTVNHE